MSTSNSSDLLGPYRGQSGAYLGQVGIKKPLGLVGASDGDTWAKYALKKPLLLGAWAVGAVTGLLAR